MATLKALESISKLRSSKQLIRSWSTVKDLRVNIQNVSPDSDENIKRTIEFRQHDGTADPQRTLAWIRTVAGFVRLVGACEQEDLNEELSKRFGRAPHEDDPDNEA